MGKCENVDEDDDDDMVVFASSLVFNYRCGAKMMNNLWYTNDDLDLSEFVQAHRIVIRKSRRRKSPSPKYLVQRENGREKQMTGVAWEVEEDQAEAKQVL